MRVIDEHILSVLNGARWCGASIRARSAWQFQLNDGGASPTLLAVRAADGLTLEVSDREGLFEVACGDVDSAGHWIEYFESMLGPFVADAGAFDASSRTVDLDDMRAHSEQRATIERVRTTNVVGGRWHPSAPD